MDHAAMDHAAMNHGAMPPHANRQPTQDAEHHQAGLIMKAPCMCGCGDSVLSNLTGASALQKALLRSIDFGVENMPLRDIAPGLPADPSSIPLPGVDHVPIA